MTCYFTMKLAMYFEHQFHGEICFCISWWNAPLLSWVYKPDISPFYPVYIHSTHTNKVSYTYYISTTLNKFILLNSIQKERLITYKSYNNKLDKYKLVLNNPVIFCHNKLDKSELVFKNPVNSCQTDLDKYKLVLNLSFPVIIN